MPITVWAAVAAVTLWTLSPDGQTVAEQLQKASSYILHAEQAMNSPVWCMARYFAGGLIGEEGADTGLGTAPLVGPRTAVSTAATADKPLSTHVGPVHLPHNCAGLATGSTPALFKCSRACSSSNSEMHRTSAIKPKTSAAAYANGALVETLVKLLQQRPHNMV